MFAGNVAYLISYHNLNIFTCAGSTGKWISCCRQTLYCIIPKYHFHNIFHIFHYKLIFIEKYFIKKKKTIIIFFCSLGPGSLIIFWMIPKSIKTYSDEEKHWSYHQHFRAKFFIQIKTFLDWISAIIKSINTSKSTIHKQFNNENSGMGK